MKKYSDARRGMYWANDYVAGTIVTQESIAVLRPLTELIHGGIMIMLGKLYLRTLKDTQT